MKEFNKIIGICVLALITGTGFIGCGEDEKPKPSKGSLTTDSGQPIELVGLHIVDSEKRPIPNAQVLIGTAQNTPFEGNFGTTDEHGVFSLPEHWTQPEIVTVDAPGYLRVSFLGMTPRPRLIELKKKVSTRTELRGSTSGHPIRNKDGYIDFSLVMSAMTRQDLLNFQVEKIISPTSDTLSAVGMQFSLPSNVSLPKQTETYFIGITLEKPQYRLFFGDTGIKRIFAARGRFAFKPVVDGLRGDADVLTLINHFSITGGSLRDVNLTTGANNLNIPVMDFTFTQKRSYKAPALSAGQVILALPVSDNNGYLIPTDVKRLGSAQTMNLSVWDEGQVYLAQILKNENEFDAGKSGIDRLSASLLPFAQSRQAPFLPLIKNPKVNSRFSYSVPTVNSTGVNQLVTYAVISDVKIQQNSDGSTSKLPQQVWEIYAPSWVQEISLPHWEWNKTEKHTRFEVSFVGSTSESEALLGPQLMEKATHVTRSSIDF